MAAADVREVFTEARVLLFSVRNPDSSQEDGQAAQVLECAFRLLDTLFSSVESGKTVTLDSSDSTIVKAVLELVVRWGIYPHLSPGVGIPLEKRFGGKSAATAAAAISKHVSGSEPLSDLALASGPPACPSGLAPTTLLQSAELLASLLLDRTQRHGSFPATTTESSQSDFAKQPANLKGNVITQISPEIFTREEEHEENRQAPAAALHQLVIFYHLPDLCAAFMQLSNAGTDDWRKLAFERLDELNDSLPVAHMVEALLTLLGQSNPAPPIWLKEKAGRMLSNLLMREGGVAAAMERLVGATQAGHVKVYERVALHLSKVPKLVTTTREYYKAVCPQLPPLFLLPLPGAGGFKEGNSAACIITNMHHTTVIMASKLAARDPKLCEEFLLRPLLRPLLEWAACISVETNLELSAQQGEMKTAGSQDGSILVESTAQTESVLPRQSSIQTEESTEALLLNAIFGMHIFITAGHDGSESIRKVVFQLVEPIAHILISVNFLLEPASIHCGRKRLDQDQIVGSIKTIDVGTGGQGEDEQGRQDFEKQIPTGEATFGEEFCEHHSVGNETGFSEHPMDIVARLRAAMTDITAALNERDGLVVASPSPLSLEVITKEWPRSDGEVQEALEAGRQRARKCWEQGVEWLQKRESVPSSYKNIGSFRNSCQGGPVMEECGCICVGEHPAQWPGRSAGPALRVLFLIAAIAAALAALCYAELSSRRSSAGSAYHNAYTCVGEGAVIYCSALEVLFGLDAEKIL